MSDGRQRGHPAGDHGGANPGIHAGQIGGPEGAAGQPEAPDSLGIDGWQGGEQVDAAPVIAVHDADPVDAVKTELHDEIGCPIEITQQVGFRQLKQSRDRDADPGPARLLGEFGVLQGPVTRGN